MPEAYQTYLAIADISINCRCKLSTKALSPGCGVAIVKYRGNMYQGLASLVPRPAPPLFGVGVGGGVWGRD